MNFLMDIDFYKLTMLQFVWKHYATLPVVWKMHSRRQDIREIIGDPLNLSGNLEYIQNNASLLLSDEDFLLNLKADGDYIFERQFINDLKALLHNGLAAPVVSNDGVLVHGTWFNTMLWETVLLSLVSEGYSENNVERPSLVRHMGNIDRIARSGARWADFGTRRRYSIKFHNQMVDALSREPIEYTGFVGTSNVALANTHDVKPIGTYAHELEMVLRNTFSTEFNTTRDVLEKWGEMYPRSMSIALTDTYTTPEFLRLHGRYLLDNNWRGIRLDSGSPREMGMKVNDYRLRMAGADIAPWDVVFSDGLTAGDIVHLQSVFSGPPFHFVNPVFGWGTGFTNPNSDLSLVMKAVESNGKPTYKITDDKSKAIS